MSGRSICPLSGVFTSGEPIDLESKTTDLNPNIIHTTAAATPTHPGLVIHAKLYALATKYWVPGLAAQAAERFGQGVAAHWNATEFLLAAREAYVTAERADRRLRDAVVAAVGAHPELLSRPQVQEVVRGLELSFDLLMHMCGNAAAVRDAGRPQRMDDL